MGDLKKWGILVMGGGGELDGFEMGGGGEDWDPFTEYDFRI